MDLCSVAALFRLASQNQGTEQRCSTLSCTEQRCCTPSCTEHRCYTPSCTEQHCCMPSCTEQCCCTLSCIEQRCCTSSCTEQCCCTPSCALYITVRQSSLTATFLSYTTRCKSHKALVTYIRIIWFTYVYILIEWATSPLIGLRYF